MHFPKYYLPLLACVSISTHKTHILGSVLNNSSLKKIAKRAHEPLSDHFQIVQFRNKKQQIIWKK